MPIGSCDAYLAALLRGDRAACAQVVKGALDAGLPIKDLYADVFRAALYAVGDLWQANRISVAAEHLATAITENVMSRVVAPALFSHDPTGRCIVVSCVANEFHQIGGRMVADLCEAKGWDSYFLGANTSIPDLLMLTGERRPDVVALSIAIFANLPVLRETIDAVRAQHAALPIWVGGQAFRWGGQEISVDYANVTIFQTFDQLEAELDRFGP